MLRRHQWPVSISSPSAGSAVACLAPGSWGRRRRQNGRAHHQTARYGARRSASSAPPSPPASRMGAPTRTNPHSASPPSRGSDLRHSRTPASGASPTSALGGRPRMLNHCCRWRCPLSGSLLPLDGHVRKSLSCGHSEAGPPPPAALPRGGGDLAHCCCRESPFRHRSRRAREQRVRI